MNQHKRILSVVAFLSLFGAAMGASAQTDALVVDEQGEVGIGTATPTAALNIVDDTATGVLVEDSGTKNLFVKLVSANFGTGFSFTATGSASNNWLMLASTADRMAANLKK